MDTFPKVSFQNSVFSNSFFQTSCSGIPKWQTIGGLGLAELVFGRVAIINVAGLAWDRVLFGSNMSLEQHLGMIKNETSTHKESIANVPAYLNESWNVCVESGKYLTKQIRNHDSKVRRRVDCEASKLSAVREDDTEPVWRRKKSSSKRGNLKKDNKRKKTE